MLELRARSRATTRFGEGAHGAQLLLAHASLRPRTTQKVDPGWKLLPMLKSRQVTSLDAIFTNYVCAAVAWHSTFAGVLFLRRFVELHASRARFLSDRTSCIVLLVGSILFGLMRTLSADHHRVWY